MEAKMIPTWTEIEKAQLLTALQTYGADNIKQLNSAIPTKSTAEIQNAIFVYESAALASLKKDQSVPIEQQYPIDHWLQLLMDSTIDANAAKDVVTAIKAVALYEQRNDPIVIGCYQYLVGVMSGTTPKELPPDAMHFLMACVDKLEKSIKEEDTAKEFEYFKNLTDQQVLTKTYSSKKRRIVIDPNLNLLKIPKELLKKKGLPDDILKK